MHSHYSVQAGTSNRSLTFVRAPSFDHSGTSPSALCIDLPHVSLLYIATSFYEQTNVKFIIWAVIAFSVSYFLCSHEKLRTPKHCVIQYYYAELMKKIDRPVAALCICCRFQLVIILSARIYCSGFYLTFLDCIIFLKQTKCSGGLKVFFAARLLEKAYENTTLSMFTACHVGIGGTQYAAYDSSASGCKTSDISNTSTMSLVLLELTPSCHVKSKDL